jgi:hypothetical protein
MTRIVHLLLWSLILLVPTHAAGQTGSGETPAQQEQNQQASSTPRQEMEGLAELMLNQGMSALEKSGKLYPFAQLAFQTEQGEKMKALGKRRGTEMEPPDDFTPKLFASVRRAIKQEPRAKAAAIVRVHEAKDKEGNTVPGLWALVDHREHPALVFFIPLLKQEDGSHKPGELVYRETDQAFFGPMPEKASKDQ